MWKNERRIGGEFPSKHFTNNKFESVLQDQSDSHKKIRRKQFKLQVEL